MSQLVPGLYEQVVTRHLSQLLAGVDDDCKDLRAIDKAEASTVLAQYLSEIIRKGLARVGEGSKDGLEKQVSLSNRIVQVLQDTVGETEEDLRVDEASQQLMAILKDSGVRQLTQKKAKDLVRPETSISLSSLFTGAPHEPQMYSELEKEIPTADRIDMLVSFIKWSGLRLLLEALEDFTARGGELRIITTSYLGATDLKAIEELQKLKNTKIKISYDTKRTRLHAKAYIFYRKTGFTTAYVGSSNISNPALTSGLEWNTKLTQKDLPETIQKISATFETYWNSPDFREYSEDQHDELKRSLQEEHSGGNAGDNPFRFVTEVKPYLYQQEILDKLQAERANGSTRNLVVAATGTGKTVLAALDYRRFCAGNPKTKRLLFVAHRQEILQQARSTFQAVLKNANFGELLVGSNEPKSLDHLFVSVQMLNSRSFTDKLAKNFYDYIVIDETHHAAAPSYEGLAHFEPQILLGLTATPERLDGKDLFAFFGNRIAAEIRLPEAIDRKLLCPFHYFGVSDIKEADLNHLKWSKGGYAKAELSKLYTANVKVAESRADNIVSNLRNYVTDLSQVKGLGFCVSRKHAAFMRDHFNRVEIPSAMLSGLSSEKEREDIKAKLVNGEIRFIFVVDIYNEGVDIPEVNTILFLRPTESPTIFLQQLGRGLRLSEGKECLTVLDFIGQANKHYSFDKKFKALIGSPTVDLPGAIKNGFSMVPKGCHIRLEKRAAEAILENLRELYNSSSNLLAKVNAFITESEKELTLENFLEHYQMEAKVFYKKRGSQYTSFSRLLVQAGKREPFQEPLEELLSKAFVRFAVIDSRRWIDFLLKFLPTLANLQVEHLSGRDWRMLQMFYVTLWDTPMQNRHDATALANLRQLAACPILLDELRQLLQYRKKQIDFLDAPVDLGFECPLDLHCTYTLDQFLVALDRVTTSSLQSGVYWAKDLGIDALVITLNKSNKDYSPTTLYNDYSITETLFHWQSQNTTGEDTPTGQRYIQHDAKGGKIALFVRETKKDPLSKETAAYTYLGTAHYVSHTDNKPMNIVWRLDHPIPAKLLKKTNKLLVG